MRMMNQRYHLFSQYLFVVVGATTVLLLLSAVSCYGDSGREEQFLRSDTTTSRTKLKSSSSSSLLFLRDGGSISRTSAGGVSMTSTSTTSTTTHSASVNNNRSSGSNNNKKSNNNNNNNIVLLKENLRQRLYVLKNVGSSLKKHTRRNLVVDEEGDEGGGSSSGEFVDDELFDFFDGLEDVSEECASALEEYSETASDAIESLQECMFPSEGDVDGEDGDDPFEGAFDDWDPSQPEVTLELTIDTVGCERELDDVQNQCPGQYVSADYTLDCILNLTALFEDLFGGLDDYNYNNDGGNEDGTTGGSRRHGRGRRRGRRQLVDDADGDFGDEGDFGGDFGDGDFGDVDFGDGDFSDVDFGDGDLPDFEFPPEIVDGDGEFEIGIIDDTGDSNDGDGDGDGEEDYDYDYFIPELVIFDVDFKDVPVACLPPSDGEENPSTRASSPCTSNEIQVIFDMLQSLTEDGLGGADGLLGEALGTGEEGGLDGFCESSFTFNTDDMPGGPIIIDPPPPNTICIEATNQVECDALQCVWCEEEGPNEGCIDESVPCRVGGGPDPDPARTCARAQGEMECGQTLVELPNTTGEKQCTWCSEIGFCLLLLEEDSECPTEPEDPITGGPICARIRDENECIETPIEDGSEDKCIWCSDQQGCRLSEDACPPAGPGACNRVQDEEACVATPIEDGSEDKCVWCESQKCRLALDACPTEEDGQIGIPGMGVCDSVEDEVLCENTAIVETNEVCQWCPSPGNMDGGGACRAPQANCPGDQSVGGPDGPGVGNVCRRVSNQTSCEATLLPDDSGESCSWCGGDQGVCRKTLEDCPGTGNSGMKVCAGIRNATKCQERDDCFYCEDKDLCRNTQQECPGQGRGNPCARLDADDCNAMDQCLFCDELGETGICTSSRGNGQCPAGRNNTDAMVDGACPLLEGKDACTTNLRCRWCENDSECKIAAAGGCSDGGLGERGNPCEAADTKDSCPNRCLWCDSKSECQIPSDLGCDGLRPPVPGGPGANNQTMGNLCRPLKFEADCEDNDECQWCPSQERCKYAQASCGEPLGDAGLEFSGNNAMFEVQDDGLGPADPKKVAIALDHLFEITEEGEMIPGSFLDFVASADFEVSQSVGEFFGDILSRRITFEASIEDVGKIEIDAYVMLEGGTIPTDDDTEPAVSVERGDVKFNVEMEDWSFCDPTSNDCGGSGMRSEFVDVAVRIQGSNGVPEPSDTDDLLFDLGSVPLMLSNEIVVDGFAQRMPEGFPRAESSDDGGAVFVFRFPRFTGSVLYDPIIEFSQSLIRLTEPPTAAPTTQAPAILVPETPPPSEPSAAVNETSAPAPAPKVTEQDPDDDEEDDSNIGAIIGGVVGGLLGLCICCAVVGYCMKNRGEGGDEKMKADDFFGVEQSPDNFKDEETGNIVGRSMDPVDEEDDDDDDSDDEEEDSEDYDDDDDDDDDDEDSDDEEDESESGSEEYDSDDDDESEE